MPKHTATMSVTWRDDSETLSFYVERCGDVDISGETNYEQSGCSSTRSVLALFWWLAQTLTTTTDAS